MVSPSPVFTFKKYKKKSPRICTWKDLKNEKKDNTGTYYPYTPGSQIISTNMQQNLQSVPMRTK